VRRAGLVAALCALVLLPGAPAPAGERIPTRIGVRGFEFGLTLSRTAVTRGPAVVQFQNWGEDPHDLRMKRVGGATEYGTGVLEDGEVAQFEVPWLKARTTYRLWCSLPGHAELGMSAALRVKRRR
jgi:hypothetical protein